MALRPHVGTSIMETYMFILLILSLESVLRLRVELPKSLGPEPISLFPLRMALLRSLVIIQLALDFNVTCS
jgi:hypothetical protein